MLKKVIIIALIFMALLGIISLFSSSFAVTGNEVLNSTQATELLEIKESTKGKLA